MYRIQLNLNSLDSSCFSLYGLEAGLSLEEGRAFSSLASDGTVGRRELKGIRKGGMFAT